jgi:hypothetical protein
VVRAARVGGGDVSARVEIRPRQDGSFTVDIPWRTGGAGVRVSPRGDVERIVTLTRRPGDELSDAERAFITWAVERATSVDMFGDGKVHIRAHEIESHLAAYIAGLRAAAEIAEAHVSGESARSWTAGAIADECHERAAKMEGA